MPRFGARHRGFGAGGAIRTVRSAHGQDGIRHCGSGARSAARPRSGNPVPAAGRASPIRTAPRTRRRCRGASRAAFRRATACLSSFGRRSSSSAHSLTDQMRVVVMISLSQTLWMGNLCGLWYLSSNSTSYFVSCVVYLMCAGQCMSPTRWMTYLRLTATAESVRLR